ncbi:hypothetical protein NF867_09595 [Solitalea sp. MAHUQ-68]|uniref:SGNH/GDSL hydrolase family protein n=1 Tax=Solitalea agri TaxID=2953739 RepID=A0A9X2F1U3_9SPHI|nr:hypothetical protein [Solitalea agri]MCO4293117.1 hypothetical protein [Solitalea agri]
MVIIIITDSLGLPRNNPEIVKLEETYIELLRTDYKCDKIVNISFGGATIEILSNQFFSYFSCINPDLIIVQSGIVDCAPRALKQWENKVLQSSSILRSVYNSVIKKHTKKLRAKRNITYTSIHKFENICNKFYEAYKNKVYWIGIAPASKEYEFNLPGIALNIRNYNNVLKNVFQNNFLDISNISMDCLMSDHHHINVSGHTYIYHKLKSIIDMESKLYVGLSNEEILE